MRAVRNTGSRTEGCLWADNALLVRRYRRWKRFAVLHPTQTEEFEERRADEQILEPLRQDPGALRTGRAAEAEQAGQAQYQRKPLRPVAQSDRGDAGGNRR